MRMTAAIALAGLLAAGIAGAPNARAQDSDSTGSAEISREFRGVWVATVANIDWPSSRTLSTEKQKAEMIKILDKCVELNLNAVVLQVRPAADALYDSKLEPWSEYLTGTQGKAPAPYYDPLTFAVEEAHKRGLELHAWFNPYRARLKASKSPAADSHISVTSPSLVCDYGDYLWMNPGEQEVLDRSIEVVRDVVKRYDIDGIHIDDYFYPYPDKDKKTSKTIEFPDADAYARYKDAGGKLKLADWRRDNVNRFVERMYKVTKQEKPWVKVGISPFGIWKPGHPKQIKGFNQYEQLYADAKLWINKGWVDYFTPQLYWPAGNPELSFPVLLHWWNEENTFKRHIWPGQFTSQAKTYEKGFTPKEIRWQIEWARLEPGSDGTVHFSMVAFLKNIGKINDELTTSVYRQPALIPPTPWLGGKAPAKPSAEVKAVDGKGFELSWKAGEKKGAGEPFVWGVSVQRGGKWTNHVLPAETTSLEIPADTPKAKFEKAVIYGVDRLGTEGDGLKVNAPAQE